MAFNTARQPGSESYILLRNEVARMRTFCASSYTNSANGAKGSQVLSLASFLGGYIATIDAALANTTLVNFVQSEFGVTLSDELTPVKEAIQATLDWIVANFPQSNGYILREQLAVDGTVTDRSFTGAQIAALRNGLNNIVSTIS